MRVSTHAPTRQFNRKLTLRMIRGAVVIAQRADRFMSRALDGSKPEPAPISRWLCMAIAVLFLWLGVAQTALLQSIMPFVGFGFISFIFFQLSKLGE